VLVKVRFDDTAKQHHLAAQRLVWADLVSDRSALVRKCSDRSNGSDEPILPNAAALSNGRYGIDEGDLRRDGLFFSKTIDH
jgi:hypothetical protein